MKDRMKEFYMDVAHRTAEMSRAKKMQVGCVIVKDDNIISFGWNGTPPGWDNNCEEAYLSYDQRDAQSAYSFDAVKLAWVMLKTKPEVIHAEPNAITKLAKGGGNGAGSTMFCTHSCCVDCAKLIIGSGIRHFIYREQYRSDGGAGLDFLKQCGADIEQF